MKAIPAHPGPDGQLTSLISKPPLEVLGLEIGCVLEPEDGRKVGVDHLDIHDLGRLHQGALPRH